MSLILPTTQNIPQNIPVAKVSSDGQVDNETALAIVLADGKAAQAYMGEKAWQLRWREIDNLYQSPRPISQWEGTMTQEANVQSFAVARYTNSIVPNVMNGIFYQDPFFIIQPTPSTDAEVARQKTIIFSAYFRDMDFENACEDVWFSTVLFGTGIAKWSDCTETRTKTTYKRKTPKAKAPGKFGGTITTKESQQYEATDEDYEYWHPEFFHVPNEELDVDPSLEVCDIRKAKFVCHNKYMTGYDLIAMAMEHEGEEGWTIPSVSTIRSWFDIPIEQPLSPTQTSNNMSNSPVVEHARQQDFNVPGSDPLMNVLKVAEHYTNKRKTVVVQDKLVICNQKNRYSKIPYYSSHWWKIPRSFWSLGIGNLIGQDQRVTQGVRNAALNLLSMAVNPPLLRKAGDNQPGQNLRLRRGAIFTVNGEGPLKDNFAVMEMPKVPPETWMMLANSDNEMTQTSGADSQLVQGTMAGSGKSSMGRTAGGAMQLAAASASRLQGPVTRFCNNLLKPWIYQMDELINEEMSEQQAEDILGEEIGRDYVQSTKFDYEKYLNAKHKFNVLAAQHLKAKQAMAQILPLMMQVFENPQLIQQITETGWTIDMLELVRMFFEISEFTNVYNVIRRQSAEEKQHQQMMQQTPEIGKAKTKIAVDNNKAQNQSDLQAEQADQKSAQIIERHILENAIQPFAETGAVGGNFETE